MRKFYIFNINPEFSIIYKDNAYDIFKEMEIIKNLNKDEYYIATQIFETYTKKINKNSINKKIANCYKDSYYYTKYKNSHMINNYYKNENTKLTVKNAYLILETNYHKPSFLKNLINNNYLACDFENKDYFWIDNLYNS